MLKYSSVVKSIYNYKGMFTPPVNSRMGVLEYIDTEYILLDGSAYIDESSLSRRRGDKMSNARIKEEYLNSDTPKKLIAKYKRSSGLCGKFGKDEKMAIINSLIKAVNEAMIDDDSADIIRYLGRVETFAEFFAACLILSITQQPLKDFIKNIVNTSADEKRRVNDLNSLTPDLAFATDIVGREELISTISYRLNANDRLIQLTGMGGIGKSEVLRGVFSYLHQHEDEHCFEYIGFFNYTGDLCAMFSRQMYHPDFSSDDLPIEFIKKLSRQYKVLLLIDDVRHEMPEAGTHLPSDSTFNDLINSKASILLSSRALLSDNFKQLPVRALSTEDCIKIFLKERYRNFYENIDDIGTNPSIPELNESEKDLLASIIEKRAGHNTLVVARLGAMARNYEWSVFQLNQALIFKDFNVCRGLLSANRDKIDEQTLQDEINKLYDIAEIKSLAQQNILEGYSILASAPLSMDAAAKFFAEDAGVDESECRALIKNLADRTWLQKVSIAGTKNDIGYYVHSIVKSAIASQVEVLDENHPNLIRQAWSEIELAVWSQDVISHSNAINIQFRDMILSRIHFQNSNEETIKNATLRVIVPECMTFEIGSVTIHNSTNPYGIVFGDMLYPDSCVNIGDIVPNAGVYLYVQLRIDGIEKVNKTYYRILFGDRKKYTAESDTVDILLESEN